MYLIMSYNPRSTKWLYNPRSTKHDNYMSMFINFRWLNFFCFVAFPPSCAFTQTQSWLVVLLLLVSITFKIEYSTVSPTRTWILFYIVRLWSNLKNSQDKETIGKKNKEETKVTQTRWMSQRVWLKTKKKAARWGRVSYIVFWLVTRLSVVHMKSDREVYSRRKSICRKKKGVMFEESLYLKWW